MRLTQVLLAAAFSLSAAAAQALTVGLIDSSPNGPGNDDDVYAANYNGSTPVGATWSGAAPVVTPPPGNVSGSYQSPFNNTPLADTQSYFSVGGSSGSNGGPSPMTLDLGQLVYSINILWGSIDTYNTIRFLDGGMSEIGMYTGQDIIDTFTLGGSASNYEQVALLNFADQSGFQYITFESSQAAFEFALAAVPVPASGLFLLMGMGGIAAMRRRKG